MEPTTDSPLSIFITGASTELGRETTRQLVARGHRVTELTQEKDGATAVLADGGLRGRSDQSG